MAEIDVRLLPDPFDASLAHAGFLARFGVLGAVTSFTGVVRGDAAGDAVDYLYLDWYPGMTEASIQSIAESAASRFDIHALCIHHRCGRVDAGAPVVFIAVAGAHRRAAFEATDYLMDRLKSEAAFWKREVGDTIDRWIEPTARDGKDLERWK